MKDIGLTSNDTYMNVLPDNIMVFKKLNDVIPGRPHGLDWVDFALMKINLQDQFYFEPAKSTRLSTGRVAPRGATSRNP